MGSIKTSLNKLKEKDVYSILLFCLYKLKETSEYSSLSELIYVLDKDNFLNICEYFGGQTITIPTIDDLSTLIQALLLYQYTKIDGIEYQEALKLLGDDYDLRSVKSNYYKLLEVLKDYSFNTRG